MKNGLITLTAIASLGLGGDAAIYNGATLIDTTIPVAEEVVALKQVDNVVEATFPWKDQAGIKVKYDLGEPTVTEKFKDKRKKEVITETVTAFEGGFKVDLLLNEEPDTNVFCYAIEGAENYDFFFQPPLTEQEKAEGASRPPEIEGSYAVYHKTLKNHEIGKENYATGKVMHIPRPQVWSMSDVDTKVWADMTYDNGNLCVTVPQDFLNGAEYPVRVDPTFGYTTAGGTSYATFNYNSLPIAGANGTVSKFTVYASQLSGGSNQEVAVALYLSSDGSLVSPQSNSVLVNNATPQWWDMTITGTLTSSAVNYQMMIGERTFSGLYAYTYYDSTSNTYYNNTVIGLISFPANLSSYSTNTNKQFSVYATYYGAPTVTTTPEVQANPRSAILSATTTGESITNYGFVYGTLSDLSGTDTSTTSNMSLITNFQNIENLTPSTKYYFKAYATNLSGTSFGSIESFTTPNEKRSRINNGTIRINNGKLDI